VFTENTEVSAVKIITFKSPILCVILHVKLEKLEDRTKVNLFQ